MGKIHAENTLQFQSSEILFNKVLKRLQSFDEMNLLDTGDFHKHVTYILEQLGQAVYKECEAILPVDKEGKTRIPANLKMIHAAFKCKPTFSSSTKSINEQKPWIYLFQTEITDECPNKCKYEQKHDTAQKVVIRTFVNGDEEGCCFGNPILLKLSPNVRNLCTDDCPSLNMACADEITIDNGYIYTKFKDDSVFLQYYGLPIDGDGLPMIPVNEDIERAIEYYIYTQEFENLYWNSSVPNIAPMLQDVRNEYENKYLPKARYWAKLPSFAKMVDSVRRARSRRKFYYSIFDRTIS